MRSVGPTDPGWLQFERMVHAGVPHALDIALELSRSNLSFPSQVDLDEQDVDLLFYGPVHHAHRIAVLPSFLDIMELLRTYSVWSVLKANRKWQLDLVERCLETNQAGKSVISTCFDYYFRLDPREGSDAAKVCTNLDKQSLCPKD